MARSIKGEQLVAALRQALQRSDVPGVVAAFLFGSHARGHAHAESDVDVGVLLDRARLPDRRARFDARVALTSLLIGEIHCNEIDVVILNDAPPLLARHIVTDGEQLFCNDKAAMHDFYRDVLLRAADLQPFLRRMAKIKLEALAR